MDARQEDSQQADARKRLENYLAIMRAARLSHDDCRCAVAPSPQARDQLKAAIEAVRGSGAVPASFALRAAEPTAIGLNDGVIIPPEAYPLGTAPSVIKFAAADRAPLQGTLRVIVVLVDFNDRHMAQTKQHFQDLFFKVGGAQKSVREYYTEVTHGLVDIQGDVVGPFRMPRTLADYAHGASGLGNVSPNAQTMAKDALLAANPTVNFTPYDNDGNGFVDAFIVIHAGTGAETNNNPNDIWSHKWTVEGGAQSVDSTKVFAYLTVPEDCRIGVCCHELGHLLFGFPDLYDTDGSSEGVGNWCLMGAGSWGGGGDKPVHPSAWCKANQGWVGVDNRTGNGSVAVQDVKTGQKVYRLWKDGASGKEYFLVENRQATGSFDVSLPGSGLLIWHIDENQTSNKDENHPWVGLMQADGKRDLELNKNRGDAGDCYPGSASNANFNNGSTPNSKSYAGTPTCVAVTGIPASGPTMTVNMQVKCIVKVKEKEATKDNIKEFKELSKENVKESKEFTKENVKDFKELGKDNIKDSLADKRPDKTISGEKPPDKTLVEGGKLGEGRPPIGDLRPGARGGPGGGDQGGLGQGAVGEIKERLAALEDAVNALLQSEQEAKRQVFVAPDLRPDLSRGALADEPDLNGDLAFGTPGAKRHFDTRP